MATVFGALLASRGLLKLGNVYAIAVAGDIVGDVVLYTLGRLGIGHRWLGRPASGTSRRQRVVSALRERLHAQPGRVLVLAKWTHAAGFLVLISAGAVRLPLGRFVAFNLIATLPKSAFFIVLGYVAGVSYDRVNFYLWLFSCAALAAIVVWAVIYSRRVAKIVPPDA